MFQTFKTKCQTTLLSYTKSLDKATWYHNLWGCKETAHAQINQLKMAAFVTFADGNSIIVDVAGKLI